MGRPQASDCIYDSPVEAVGTCAVSCWASNKCLLLWLDCRSYILAYNSHQLKDIFNVHTLDLQAVAKAFGFTGACRSLLL